MMKNETKLFLQRLGLVSVGFVTIVAIALAMNWLFGWNDDIFETIAVIALLEALFANAKLYQHKQEHRPKKKLVGPKKYTGKVRKSR